MIRTFFLAVLLLAPGYRHGGAQQLVTTRQVHASHGSDGAPRTGDTVRVSGRVALGTGVLHDSRLHVFIQDSTGAVAVQQWRVPRELTLQAGDSATAVGVVERDGGEARLGNAQVVRFVGERRHPQALPVETLAPASLDAAGVRLVVVEGTVTRALVGRGARALALAPARDSMDALVVVEQGEGVVPMKLDRFAPGDRIRVTGVLARRPVGRDNRVPHLVYPRSAVDLHPLTMTARAKQQLAFGAIAFLALALLAWAIARARALSAASRRHRENALRENAERYRLMVAHAPVGILVHRGGASIFANEQFARIVGSSSADALRDCDVLSLVHPADRASAQQRIRRVLAGDAQVVTQRRTLLRLDGTPIETEVTSSRILLGGEPAVQAVVHDVGERRRAELALRESEARFRLVARATNDVVWDWNVADDHVTWAEATLSVLGYTPTELAGSAANWRDRIHEEDRTRIAAALYAAIDGGAESWQGEYRFRRKCGAYAHVFDRGYILRAEDGRAVRLVGAMQDLTERMRLEERLRQAQKMEAVGKLAAGIAHDFNNLLTVMSTYSEFVLADLPPESASRADVEEIQRAGTRAVGLTRQLLSFSRRDVVRSEVFDLNAVVRDTEKLLRRTIGEQITLEVALHPGPCNILGDRGQIDQVLMNLVINARDAMAARGGTITIETGVHDAARLPRAAAERAGSGRQVLLSVRDTGPGMDEATLSRIFEPFFTTKATGAGTGLGLATVYGIVSQASGSVWAESTPGRGSTFFVLLPEAARSSDAEHLPQAGQNAAARLRATILLVEDEAPVRLAVARSLAREGLQVMQAKNATDAVMIWNELRHEIDAVITDIVMPGIRGPDLVARLREDRPSLPVLFISGYTDLALDSTDLSYGETAFLAKPFSIEDLHAELRALLEEPAVSRS